MGASINFSQLSVQSRYLLSTFHLPRDPLSTFMTFLCVHKTFFKLSAQPQDFCQLPSTFRASTGPYINFLCVCKTFLKISMQLPDLPSTSVNILCICGTFYLLLCVHRTSIKFCQLLCVHGLFEKVLNSCWIFCQHQSTFRVVAGLSVNFCQLSMRPRDYSLTFRVSVGHSVNVSELPCGRRTFHQLSVHLQDLSSTFGVFAEIYVNFRQLSVGPRDLLSTFRASVGPSVNFR